MKLYEYDDIIETLYRAQESEDGVDNETGMVLDITLLDQLEMARDKKIESALLYAKQLEAEADVIEDYIRQRKKIADSKKNAAQDIREWLMARMREHGDNKFETEKISATLKITPLYKTEIIDDALIPQKFIRTKTVTTTSADKLAIKAAIKAGEEVPGAMLVDSVSLTVK